MGSGASESSNFDPTVQLHCDMLASQTRRIPVLLGSKDPALGGQPYRQRHSGVVEAEPQAQTCARRHEGEECEEAVGQGRMESGHARARRGSSPPSSRMSKILSPPDLLEHRANLDPVSKFAPASDRGGDVPLRE